MKKTMPCAGRKRSKRQTHNHVRIELTPADFERMVSALSVGDGYVVRETPRTITTLRVADVKVQQ